MSGEAEKHDPGYVHVCYRDDMWKWGDSDAKRVSIPPEARRTLQRAIRRSEIADGIRKPPRWWQRLANRLGRNA